MSLPFSVESPTVATFAEKFDQSSIHQNTGLDGTTENVPRTPKSGVRKSAAAFLDAASRIEARLGSSEHTALKAPQLSPDNHGDPKKQEQVRSFGDLAT